MAKHGTLPEYMYQQQCISAERPINVSFEEPEEEEEEEARIDESGEETEYDQSSDEDYAGGSNENGNYLQEEIGSSTTFLLGAKSRFGRAIRFNNRLFLKLFHAHKPYAL